MDGEGQDAEGVISAAALRQLRATVRDAMPATPAAAPVLVGASAQATGLGVAPAGAARGPGVLSSDDALAAAPNRPGAAAQPAGAPAPVAAAVDTGFAADAEPVAAGPVLASAFVAASPLPLVDLRDARAPFPAAAEMVGGDVPLAFATPLAVPESAPDAEVPPARDERPLVHIAEAPEVRAADVAGTEDSAVRLDLAAALADLDGSETLALSVLGVPAGAVLSAGVRQPDGSWSLLPGQLAGLSITPPRDFSGAIALTLRATSTETANGDSETVERAFTVQVAAVADAPEVRAADVAGSEDSAIALELAAALADLDGSETLALSVLGVPAGAVLSAGVRQPDGSWSLLPGQLAGLTLTPPQDFAGAIGLTLRATSTEAANGDSETVERAFTVQVAAVADAPEVRAADVAGTEDSAVRLDLAAALADLDGSETLALSVLGVPAGAVLSAGVRQPDGSWSLLPGQLAGLSITPPRDFSGAIALTLRATSTETANGDSETVERAFTVQVAAVADAPEVRAADVAGAEDSAIALDLAAALADLDGSETLALSVLGVPDGAVLSAGLRQPDGSWSLLPGQLAGLSITPPRDFSGAIALTLRATAQDGTTSATTTRDFVVQVSPVADAPEVRAADVAGAEDSAIALDLAAALADLDGSETLALSVLGVPGGAVLSAGVRQPDGSWSLLPGQLAGLTLTPPQDFAGAIGLTLRATSTETANGDSETVERAFTVQVTPVADAPEVRAADVAGAEDSAIALELAAALADLDGSETLALSVLGVPDGAVLSAGLRQPDGSWSLLPGQLAGLSITPPRDFAGAIGLTLRATAQDGTTSATTTRDFVVQVSPVADAPEVRAADVAGAEDSAIALDLAAALADLDGSETLALSVLGVPDGAVLSAGLRQPDGSWSLLPGQLAGLSITPPRDFSGAIALTLRATAQDGTTSATTTRDFVVQVSPVADAPEVRAADVAGAEDSAIALDLAAALADLDGSETLALSVLGVPDGAVLSAGLRQPDGSWSLLPGQLAGLSITPPRDFAGAIGLTLRATAQDGTTSATTTRDFVVQVSPVADAPEVRAADVAGAEDSAIALDLAAALADLDGSETLALSVLGVPEGAVLSAGLRQPDGSWSLLPGQLAGLSITPPRDFAGAIGLTLRATAQDGTTSATTTRDFVVQVSPVADAAQFAASGEGREDSWIPIRGRLALNDTDGSETLGPGVTITGVPPGALLSHGTESAPGTWIVARDVFEAGALAIQPPANSDLDFSLELAVETHDGSDAAVTRISALISVRAAADAPLVQVADARGMEDTPIRLTGLGGALTDADGSETLSFRLTGVPSTATLSSGTRNGDGSWTLTPAQLASVSIRPPAHFSGTMALTLTAISTEARDGRPQATTAASFTVAVDPVADAGSISGRTTGAEDGWITIRPTFATPDTDGSESWSATTVISGVPAGAMLNAGAEVAPGVWHVTTADLRAGRVAIRPPEHSDADFSLTLRATLRDSGNGTTVEREVTGVHTVTVLAVADAPVVSATDAAGSEDAPIALNLAAALVDRDGSERLGLAVLGMPEGAMLSAGARQADGSWSVTADQLAGLSLTPPRDFAGRMNLTLRAVATDNDGSAATSTAAFSVQVDAVADAPTLRVGPAMGAEDTAIGLRVSGATTDIDGSERLVGFRISGLPEGGVLRAGGAILAREADGSVIVDAADAGTLTVTPPPDSDADFTLRVTSIAEEPNGSRAESPPRDLPVRVTAVADAPVWLRIGAAGAEDAPIPLEMAARLADIDGSEALSLVVSGLPPGAVLSAGTYRGPGSWSLTAAEAATVTMTPPADFAGTITLTVTAVGQERDGGHQALSTVSFPVHVAATVDSRNWSAGASGREDQPIALALAPPLRDSDGSERLVGEALVEGVPAGAVLRLGDWTVVEASAGVHRIPVARLAGVTLTMPPDSDVAAQLSVRVTVEDTGGVRAELRGTVTVDPAGVADMPRLDVADAKIAGHDSDDAAKGWASLPILATLADTDGSETLHVWIRDVPEGFVLSAGTPAGDGAWLLRGEELAKLGIRPPAGYSGEAALRVQVVATEREGDSEVAEAKLALVVAPSGGGEGGAPGTDGDGGGAASAKLTLALDGGKGSEDEAAPLAIKVSLEGTDVTLGIQVSGLPAGARLSAGLHDAERDVWILRPEELDGLQLIPPRDFAGDIALHVTAMAVGPTGGRTTATDKAVFSFDAVADGPSISAGPPAAVEDRSVLLNLGVAARDGDGSESVVAITLSGLTPGATIASAPGIQDNGNGTWTVQPWTAGAVRLQPPPDAHGTFSLTVTATVREASNGATATTSRGVSVTVAPVPDAPIVSAADAAGREDQAIALGLSAALADRDGSEALSVVISGMPDGARLSAGINNGDGSWTLNPAQLAGLTVTPPGNWSGTMALTLRAHAMERSTGEVATTAVDFNVAVGAVADAPLVYAATTAAGAEDQPIPLVLAARLADADGSETLTVVVRGVPAGASFSAGTMNPDGSWTIPGAALPGLTFTPPPHYSGTVRLDVAVTATEAEGDTAAVSFQLAVTVDPVADAPIIALAGIAGDEDTPLRLPLSATLVDGDGSESIVRFVVAGLPPGATLSAGTAAADGSWTLTAAQAAGVSLVPPRNWSGTVELGVTAVSQEAVGGAEASSRTTLSVTVNPVADAPTVTARGVSGAEDSAIALDLAAALADLDGSETLALSVLGVPDGAVLSAGVRQPDGSWSLLPGQLAGLSITPPRDFSGAIALTLRATSTETANGDSETVERAFTVQVTPVADAPVVRAADVAGTEDSAIALDLAAALADMDGSETLALSVLGVPAGAVLSAGVRQPDGSWSLLPGQLAGLSITPPRDFAGAIALTLRATSQDGTTSATTTRAFTVQVAPVNDAPLLALTPAPRGAAGATQADAIGDATLVDLDSTRMGGATITLSGGEADERLVFDGYELRMDGGRLMIGDTGIAMERAADGTVTLRGAASVEAYEGVLEALAIENQAGLAAGTRSIGVTLHDEQGATAATQHVALRVEPSVIAGGASDAVLAGTAGHDTFLGGAGNETMLGGAGADLFIVGSDGGQDRVDGGAGSWIDAVHVDGVGAPGADTWTLVLDGTPQATVGARSLDFAEPVSGHIHFADGTQVELAQIERITW